MYQVIHRQKTCFCQLDIYSEYPVHALNDFCTTKMSFRAAVDDHIEQFMTHAFGCNCRKRHVLLSFKITVHMATTCSPEICDRAAAYWDHSIPVNEMTWYWYQESVVAAMFTLSMVLYSPSVSDIDYKKRSNVDQDRIISRHTQQTYGVSTNGPSHISGSAWHTSEHASSEWWVTSLFTYR